MAEKTEFLQAIDDAILDADSLERFINGSDDETVLTRLSAEYPTLQKAIKQMFENGGLPAEPFATKALMEASTLVDGDYAQVTDDTVNNGLYVKTAGNWVKSEYNPVSQSQVSGIISDIDGEIADIRGSVQITPSIVQGVLVQYTAGAYSIYLSGPDRSYARIKVDGYQKMIVEGAITSQPVWVWIFTAADMVTEVGRTPKAGNGVFDIPSDAYYAVKTNHVASANAYENADIKVTVVNTKDTILSLAEKVRGNSAILDGVSDNIGIIADEISDNDLQLLDGAVVGGVYTDPSVLFVGDDRQYHKIKVEGADAIRVTGAVDTIKEWRWVFSDANMSKVLKIANNYGDGTYSVPKGAVWAVKTAKVGSIVENTGIEVKAIKRFSDIVSGKPVEPWMLPTKSPEDIIKESGMPVVKVSDFEGANSHEKIDAAIEFIKMQGQGILDLESGVHVRNSAILVPSNCWIYLNNATLKLADGVFDNVIRNEGIVVNPDPYGYATELNENVNIRIFGRGTSRALLSGADVAKIAPYPNGDPGHAMPWTSDIFGWRTINILLANVKDYAIHDFRMENSKAWSISQEHGCENFEIYNLEFLTPVANGDGIDMRMGCKNGRIYNITGFTGDDMVAMSAINGFIDTHPSGRYIYPMQVGGYADRGFGIDIENIKISNIRGSGKFQGIRLLASGGSKVRKISINNVSDSPAGKFQGPLVYISSGYGVPATLGDIADVTVNGVVNYGTKMAVYNSMNLKNAWFNNIEQKFEAEALILDTSTGSENVKKTNLKY